MAGVDLLAIQRGHISAPAGYGKTQLIAESLTRHDESLPVLVLTHTNSGVAALRKRLSGHGVSSDGYVLRTLDGWALRLLAAYPGRAQINAQHLNIANPGEDYPEIQRRARGLIEGGHVDRVLRASYSHMVVDEYQDCSLDQHAMIVACAGILPTVVLGDPMQSVFGFAGRRVDWNNLGNDFPEHHELDIPWRWDNAGAPQIGSWLADVRRALLDGAPIDLNNLPGGVVWRRPAPPRQRARNETAELRELARAGSVLVIGPSANANARHNFARNTPGVIVVEPVELSRLAAFARNLNLDHPFYAVEQCASLARDVMTGLGRAGDFRARIERIHRNGQGRFKVNDADRAALDLVASPSYTAVANLLKALRGTAQSRLFRPTVYDATLCALSRASADQFENLAAAARAERDVRRHQERTAGKIAIGSTLLLKGLEADSCMIMNAHTLNRHDLYVALTRGAKRICIWSERATLRPG
ncbi:UvrD-helicase domain-containing protein [Salinisphaera sp.]|uniref:UvrD-helicase domain-containing protein n=1 Tax=Salinisphaera sp. TaxID=1914330 RepID=UPI000C65F1EA|nr:UvrD-helicase domain-containing protein [Salinisphaera sp.]MBS61350.1 DNA helicase UvrD [Salinisphaera sp.]